LYPSRFAYRRASELADAIEALAQAGEETKILAGGQSLIPLMKLRLAAPKRLLDIGRLKELTGIHTENGHLRIGALTRHASLETASLPRSIEFLREAARVIGDPQVRNMGTVGGALAEADPAGDWGAAFLALSTSVVARSVAGEREIPLKEFFLDAYTSALRADEVVMEVRVGLPPHASGGAYLKLERKAGDFPVASCAVFIERKGASQIASAGVGLAGVGLTPVKAAATENILNGKFFDEEVARRAAEILVGEINPLADLRGSADYKRAVAATLFRRALKLAWERAMRSDQ
jgi:carbon-monoxide dehydrogenase medium subunit